MALPAVAAVVRSVGTALPEHYAPQEQILAALRERWSRHHFNLERLEELHRAVQVKGRYLALPIGEYAALDTFEKRNRAWAREGLALAERAMGRALDAAGLKASQVDHLFFTTVTGIATPSLDARLVNRMGLRPDCKRTPLFGLGCVGGAAGLARAADYLRAFPRQTAVLLSVELCSLTLQQEDLSIPNIIASGLFGDGTAAVVLEGRERGPVDGPAVLASRSVFYPDTERVMGWDIVEGGFKIVLSAKVPEIVHQHARQDVDAFLGEHGLTRRDVRHWLVHTGGPKVLQAFENSLELPPQSLRLSWESLREVGNLSSASVLFVLADELERHQSRRGELGLLMALGPGFCSELVLLQW